MYVEISTAHHLIPLNEKRARKECDRCPLRKDMCREVCKILVDKERKYIRMLRGEGSKKLDKFCRS